MGYRLNRLDEPVFMAVPKPMLTEFGIHHRLESCADERSVGNLLFAIISLVSSSDMHQYLQMQGPQRKFNSENKSNQSKGGSAY